jgi:hypothetical protein
MSARTPGLWEVDTVRNEGEYGDGGPDSHIGFDSFAIIDAEGRVLFDSLNRDAAITEVDEESDDEDGHHHAWDRLAKADAEHLVRCVNAHDTLVEALREYDDAFTEFDPDNRASRHRMRIALIRGRAAIAKATGSPS